MINDAEILRIIDRFHKSRNILQKRELDPILAKVVKEGYKSSQIYASIGEDAAAIQVDSNSDDLILLSTDAILPSFIQNSPYAAGYSAVYVGLDDIFACGGQPLAISVTMEYGDNALGQQMLQGILDATQKFRIPLIRGHTVTDSKSFGLTSTIIGRSTKSDFISIKDTQAGDLIYLVVDPNGEPGKINRFYWNTILNTDYDTFYQKRSWIQVNHRNGLFHGCKDISNGGILGTLYQLMSYSELGCQIMLNSIENTFFIKNSIYNLEDLLFTYLTSSFLIMGSKINREKLLANVLKTGLMIYEIGIITSHGFSLQYNNHDYPINL
jgi:selenophosphate synthetase-related protein